jgi:hypothetical protein
MKLIPLSKNQFAKVDDSWFDYLNQWKWHYDGKYARRHTPRINGTQGNVLLHRVIAKTPKGKFTDHIDGDELNNQESNLRTCNHKQNAANQKKAKNKSSLYKGVSSCEGRWRAQVTFDDRKVYDAMFAEERHAAMAADLNAYALYGEFARLNFPDAILVVQE